MATNHNWRYNVEKIPSPAVLPKSWDSHFSLFLLFLVFLSPLSLGSSTEISLGSTLQASKPNQTWSSPNTTFSLGFIPVAVSSSYSLAISFAGGGAAIPIWRAGGVSTVADSSASFQLSEDGDLLLTNGSGSVLWRSSTSGLGVSHAVLDNSGNFILKNGSVSVWTSFTHPTDTIVPGQNLTLDTSLSSGLYSCRLNRDGNLSLVWKNSIVYWTFGANITVNVNLSNPTLTFQSSGVITLEDPSLSNPANLAYSSNFGDTVTFRFLRLDSDGNLRTYSFDAGSGGTTTVTWTGVNDQCEVFGYCGNMGICSYGGDGNPVCGCPSDNFDPIDPNDGRKGCKRKVELQDCVKNWTLLEMNHTRFLTYPPESSTDVFIVDSSACRFNCLDGVSCVASTILATAVGNCYIKTSSSVSGYQAPIIPSTSFVKVCSPVIPNPPPPSLETGDSGLWRLHPWVVVIIALCMLSLVVILVVGILWLCCSAKKYGPAFGGIPGQYSLLEYASGAPVHFSYKELRRYTKGFREKLGVGGFGSVYRGLIPMGKIVVAVKHLEGIEQGEKQFRMEVATISSTHHLNLVRLIGFCSEGRHRLLVYEFMKNGSLDHYLFATEEQQEYAGKALSWENRFKIAVGTARGITYLHEECRDCIVHCDIKPENILLDDNYNAKVSDFGLAKLINPDHQRHQSMKNVRGTRGYLAPEWLSNLPITSKSDVYSYGMVLLEIVSGKRNFQVSQETNGKKFSVWASEEFGRGNVNSIVDKRLKESELDMDQVIRSVMVSLWCIQEQPTCRPMMGRVVQMLEGIVEIEQPPLPSSSAAAEESVVVELRLGMNRSYSNGAMSMVGSDSNGAMSVVADAGSGPDASSFSSFRTGTGASSSPPSLERPSSTLLKRKL